MLNHLTNMNRTITVVICLLAIPAVLIAAEPTDSDKKRIVEQMFAEYSKEFPTVKIITPGKAMEAAELNNLVVVDVRRDKEMAVSVIPGSITKTEFLKHPDRFKNKTIVAYCTIGYRSGLFAEEMQKQGIDVYNLKGGILSWALEGGHVRNKTGIVKRIHVYGEKWRYVPEGYQAVVFGFFEKAFN